MSLEENKYETLIQGLLQDGFGMMDDFLEHGLVAQLRNRLLTYLSTGEMKQAGIGQLQHFQQNSEIRRDLIHWIDPEQTDAAEQSLLHAFWSFIHYLNETCYTGLNGMECHYAWYDTGSFYKKHLDQFKTDAGRKFSVILYLNENWITEDGGQLVLYLKNRLVTINPFGGRLVFFESEKIEHEVLPTAKPRLSITGWMKQGY